jgi:hypothetical protein
MKRLKTYILISLLIGTTFSCEDFLTEENRSSITAESYLVTKDGYEALVNSAYATLRNVWGYEDPWLFCLGVDIYTRGNSVPVGGSYEGRDINSIELNEYGTLDAQNTYVSRFYTDCYNAIQTCNTAINRANMVENITEPRKAQLVAEVSFLRAYYYYLLAEQFGDVPLVTNEITSAVTHFDRTPEKDVYKFIVSELGACIDKLPATPEKFGRVTKGAANNLLALIHLTRGYKSYAEANDFSLAASLADGVINSGSYSLVSSFNDLFTPGKENNKEIIFSIQYDKATLGASQVGNGQSVYWGWELWMYEPGFEWLNTTYNNHISQFMPTQFLYSLFNTNNDSRYDVTFKSSFNATIDDPALGIKKGDLKVYFPKPDQPFTKQDSIDFMAKNPKANIITFNRWKQSFNNIGGSGKFPMVWKFFDPDAIWHGNNDARKGTRDIFLFRLAETYLIAAEAYHKAGDNLKAADRINSVRNRAALPGKTSAMQISASNVDLDFILDERARELVGEYKRWMDLKRTKKLIERTLKHNNLAKSANQIKDYHLLRPIPQSVRDRDSGEFPQNPGYN